MFGIELKDLLPIIISGVALILSFLSYRNSKKQSNKKEEAEILKAQQFMDQILEQAFHFNVKQPSDMSLEKIAMDLPLHSSIFQTLQKQSEIIIYAYPQLLDSLNNLYYDLSRLIAIKDFTCDSGDDKIYLISLWVELYNHLSAVALYRKYWRYVRNYDGSGLTQYEDKYFSEMITRAKSFEDLARCIGQEFNKSKSKFSNIVAPLNI